MSETQAPDAPRPPDIGRRTLTPFGYAVCVAVPILIAAIGFTYPALPLRQGRPGRAATGSRSSPRTGSPATRCDDALVTGELVLGDDGCLRLDASDGTQVELVWPADYEATVQRVGPSDQLKVYDPDRDIVARSGDTIELGGGFGRRRRRTPASPCAPGSGEVFLVQSELRVVDASS